MYAINGRDLRRPSKDVRSRYVNKSAEVVDGKVVLTISDPVCRSLANEYSVSMNALTRLNSQPLRQRMNVDAVDLTDEISLLQ